MTWLTIAKTIVLGVYELAHELRHEILRERAERAAACKVIDLATVRASRRAPKRAS